MRVCARARVCVRVLPGATDMLIFPMNAFPWVLSGMLEARVSGRRLSSFLLQAKLHEQPRVSAP